MSTCGLQQEKDGILETNIRNNLPGQLNSRAGRGQYRCEEAPYGLAVLSVIYENLHSKEI